MRTFNELSEAYERKMLARAEPEKERTMKYTTWAEVSEPTDSNIYNWEAFVEWAESKGIQPDEWLDWWECWKEGYTTGVESMGEDE